MRSSIGRSATRRDHATPATRRGVLLVACAAVCWSSGGLIARLVTTTPWTTSLWRSVFATLFLAVVLRVVRGRGIVAQWRDGGRPLLAVAACMALASTCFIFSLTYTSVANTLILISTGPYVAGLLAGSCSASGPRCARGSRWAWRSPAPRLWCRTPTA